MPIRSGTSGPKALLRTLVGENSSRVVFAGGIAIQAAFAGCAVAACTPARESPRGGSATQGAVVIQRAVVWGLASARSGTLGLRATCGSADTLVEAKVDGAEATLHTIVGGRMDRTPGFPCAPRKDVVLGKGDHIMLREWSSVPAIGDSVRVTLRWARAGSVSLVAPYLSFSDAQSILGR